ncbi:hypothetical protein [Yoonia sp. SS1-5]|uniref:Uncharacterized protein n=1 Tax=Yoonia rhodophyticola TaxID=3137370 RepID=A0AAN0MAJ8_9RHOB
MKHSPLCSRDGGAEIMFTAKDGDAKYRFVMPRSLLDTACGATAGEVARKKWVTRHLPDILATRHGASTAPAPFNRVCVEEIS